MADENVDIRFRLRGANEAAREAYRTAGAFKAVGAASRSLDRDLDRVHRRTFLFNQAMFTARRVLYSFTLGATAAAGALAFMGFKFRATMEQNTIAMKFLLGSMDAATREVDFLFDLAKKTPFQFAGLTDVARKFLGFGFTVDQTNRYLTATADAMAAMGGNLEIADRIARAFGQIRSKGRLMGQEMLQLTDAQIPAYEILREELGLTGKQMSNLARTGIDATTALEALTRGMNRRFAGASAELAKTVTGQFEKLKDTTSQLMGDIMMAPFIAVQRNFPRLLTTMEAMSDAMRTGGFFAMVHALDESISAGGRLDVTLRNLHSVMLDLAAITQGALWPALKANVAILWLFLKPLLIIGAGVLNLAAHFKTALVPILFVLIAAWTAHKIILIANWFWQHKNNRAIRSSITWIFKQIAALKLWAFATTSVRNKNFALNTMVLKNNGAIAKMTRVIFGVIAATRAWIVSLVLLRTTIYKIPVIGWILAIIAAAILLETKFHIIQNTITKFWRLLIRFRNWITSNKISWDDFLPGKGFLDVLKFMPGGAGMGLAWEVAKRIPTPGGGANTLPTRSALSPIKPATMDWNQVGGAQGMNVTIVPQPINIDGRQVAEAVYKHKLDKFARA